MIIASITLAETIIQGLWNFYVTSLHKHIFFNKYCMTYIFTTIFLPKDFLPKNVRDQNYPQFFYYSIAKTAGNLWLILFSLIKVWKCERQNYAGRSLQTLLVELLGCIWYDFHYFVAYEHLKWLHIYGGRG